MKNIITAPEGSNLVHEGEKTLIIKRENRDRLGGVLQQLKSTVDTLHKRIKSLFPGIGGLAEREVTIFDGPEEKPIEDLVDASDKSPDPSMAVVNEPESSVEEVEIHNTNVKEMLRNSASTVLSLKMDFESEKTRRNLHKDPSLEESSTYMRQLVDIAQVVGFADRANVSDAALEEFFDRIGFGSLVFDAFAIVKEIKEGKTPKKTGWSKGDYRNIMDRAKLVLQTKADNSAKETDLETVENEQNKQVSRWRQEVGSLMLDIEQFGKKMNKKILIEIEKKRMLVFEALEQYNQNNLTFAQLTKLINDTGFETLHDKFSVPKGYITTKEIESVPAMDQVPVSKPRSQDMRSVQPRDGVSPLTPSVSIKNGGGVDLGSPSKIGSLATPTVSVPEARQEVEESTPVPEGTQEVEKSTSVPEVTVMNFEDLEDVPEQEQVVLLKKELLHEVGHQLNKLRSLSSNGDKVNEYIDKLVTAKGYLKNELVQLSIKDIEGLRSDLQIEEVDRFILGEVQPALTVDNNPRSVQISQKSEGQQSQEKLSDFDVINQVVVQKLNILAERVKRHTEWSQYFQALAKGLENGTVTAKDISALMGVINNDKYKQFFTALLGEENTYRDFYNNLETWEVLAA